MFHRAVLILVAVAAATGAVTSCMPGQDHEYCHDKYVDADSGCMWECDDSDPGHYETECYTLSLAPSEERGGFMGFAALGMLLAASILAAVQPRSWPSAVVTLVFAAIAVLAFLGVLLGKTSSYPSGRIHRIAILTAAAGAILQLVLRATRYRVKPTPPVPPARALP